MRLSEIAKAVNGTLSGGEDCEITGVAAIAEAKPGDITFFWEKKFSDSIKKTKASAIISNQPLGLPTIVVKNPRLVLPDVISLFHRPAWTPGVSPKADVHPTAVISPSARIDAFAVIGPRAVIGDQSWVRSHAVVADDCQVGRRCVLHPGCVIGAEGFGFVPNKEKWKKIPHIGNVVIGDDVEIGANTCVARGCLDSTVIGSGTKIDNLSQIAHNVKIGENGMITGLVGIMGSAELGNHVTVGGQVGISSVKIGDNVTIAAKSGVTKDIKDNSVVSGFPAQDHHEELKIQAKLRRLVLPILIALFLSLNAYASTSIYGPTGLIAIPTAEALKYKEVTVGYDYVLGANPALDDWIYKLNIGTFQNWEIGIVGGRQPSEGVFVNAKYHLMSDTTRFPMMIAIGVENLASATRTDLYMVASKRFKGGFGAHLGFKANFNRTSVSPSVMAGFEYLFSNQLSVLADINGQDTSYFLNSGLYYELTPEVAVKGAVMDIFNSARLGVGYSFGVVLSRFL